MVQKGAKLLQEAETAEKRILEKVDAVIQKQA
jgi:hypothetical protein